MSLVERNLVLSDQSQSTNVQNVRERSPSLDSPDIFVVSQRVLDFFDGLYSDRMHRYCMNVTFLTLISMTLSIVTWMFFWIAENRSNNAQDPDVKLSLYDLQITLETFTIALLGITPVLFVIMISSWMRYFCYNPMIAIRNKFIGFRLENEQWKAQLDDYYRRKSSKFSHGFRCVQRKELYERNYGYVILSSHGIVIDELMLLSADRNIVDKGEFLDDNKILKVTCKRTWTRPWKISVGIHLPNIQLNQDYTEEIHKLAKVPFNSHNCASFYVRLD